ncbi:hypothetical protein QR680_008006 [Steinernema hermaphroditum]|uniref:Uncharacterized protein n=1 Tax=Steinernema hermaphroditum TaxID=289476 RepID=A0AA39IHD3_9BILA|nr:hypothetical protein QR680_008006 [Steinernema hermaphroditum]
MILLLTNLLLFIFTLLFVGYFRPRTTPFESSPYFLNVLATIGLTDVILLVSSFIEGCLFQDNIWYYVVSVFLSILTGIFVATHGYVYYSQMKVERMQKSDISLGTLETHVDMGGSQEFL